MMTSHGVRITSQLNNSLHLVSIILEFSIFSMTSKKGAKEEVRKKVEMTLHCLSRHIPPRELFFKGEISFVFVALFPTRFYFCDFFSLEQRGTQLVHQTNNLLAIFCTRV